LALSSSEIFHVGNTLQSFVNEIGSEKNIYAYPKSVLDDKGGIIKLLQTNTFSLSNINKYVKRRRLQNWLPFFSIVDRHTFINIGGYDEDFIGNCYDDADIACRFVGFNDGIPGLLDYKRVIVDATVIHLYHGRHSGVKNEGWYLNKNLYETKTVINRQLIRNVSR